MKAIAVLAGLAAICVLAAPARGVLRHDRVVGTGLVRFNGKGPEAWARAYRLEHRRFLGEQAHRLRAQRRLKFRIRSLSSVGQSSGPFYAIRLASAVFGVPESEMRAVASCETGGSFSATSLNSSSGAAGEFQFLSSTWARAGIPGFSVFDPIANSLAAARLVIRDGGWSEWSCKPR